MFEKRRRPTEIMDSPEHRAIPIDSFDVEENSDNTLTLTGYASTFQPYDMYGGPSNGYGWIEQIDRGAFERTLKEGPDLHLLINHEGLPLARTKSGTLDLSVDDHGLHVVARLDRSDPDVQRLEPKMRRKDMDEMSFAFRVKGQKWEATPEFKDDPEALRTITEVSLHKGDVSVVNFGANPTTHAELASVDRALAVLADCDPRELVEARSGSDVLLRAKAKLANVGLTVEADLRAVDGPGSIPIIGSLIEPREAKAYTSDVTSLIKALDATLDEAVDLSGDADRQSLPEPVAQALDLLLAAQTIAGDLMKATDTFDPDAPRANDEESETREDAEVVEMRESVSDHAWDFPQSAYTPEQWRHACLIDSGEGDPDSKSRYHLPVREPDGTLNRNGVHAAAGRLDQVGGISDDERTVAAKKLVSLYRDQLHEDPPAHLLDMAHERSADGAHEYPAVILAADDFGLATVGFRTNESAEAWLRMQLRLLEHDTDEDGYVRDESPQGMSLREALIAQGIAPEGELSLAEAKALSE